MATGGGTIEMRQAHSGTRECQICRKEADLILQPSGIRLCSDCEHTITESPVKEVA